MPNDPTREEVLEWLDNIAAMSAMFGAQEDVPGLRESWVKDAGILMAAARLIRAGQNAVPREVALKACDRSYRRAYEMGLKHGAKAPNDGGMLVSEIRQMECDAALAAAEKEAKP